MASRDPLSLEPGAAGNGASITPGREILDGTAHLGLTQVVTLGAGFVIATTLTRWLEPHGYGQYSLAVNIVLLVELSVSTLLFPAVKHIADADDPQPVATSMLRLFLGAGAVCGIALFSMAGLLAELFDEPSLKILVPILALDVPLFAWSQAHIGILLGLGRYRQRAVLGVVRWCARVVLVVALVGAGLSVAGAILGLLLSSCVEALLCRRLVGIRLLGGPAVPMRRLAAMTGALVGAAFVIRLFVGLDLFMLKGLGASTAAIGLYASAQTLSTTPIVLLTGSVQSILAALSRAISSGRVAEARAAARTAMRTPFWILPIAAAVAGSSASVMALLFGEPYRPAGPTLTLLVFASVAMLGLMFANSAVAAAGFANHVLRDMVLALTVAVPAHLLMIPHLGAVGAALATTMACTLGMIASLVSLHRTLRALPPVGTVVRCSAVAVLAGAASVVWSTDGAMVVVELGVISLCSAVALVLIGELGRADRHALLTLVGKSSSRSTGGSG